VVEGENTRSERLIDRELPVARFPLGYDIWRKFFLTSQNPLYISCVEALIRVLTGGERLHLPGKGEKSHALQSETFGLTTARAENRNRVPEENE
jgi:hypothetical protein